MEVLTHLLKPDILELLVGFAVLVTILVLAGSVFQKISSCPYRKFCAAHEGCHSPQPDRKPQAVCGPASIW